MLANLDNEVIFKKAFTDKLVFRTFVRDVLGIDIEFGKIETEKQFSPKIGYVDFKLDVYAESEDKRVIVELQRIQYDRNFDRFLHYFLAAIIELQKSAAEYKISQTVYFIVIMTEPYKWDDKLGNPVRDELLMMRLNPRTILGEERAIYGHQFVCLNPNHPEDHTPQSVRDWLDLVHQSIHNPQRPTLNKNNEGIKRAAELINFDDLTSDEIETMKNNEATKVKQVSDERYAMLKQAGKFVLSMHKEGDSIERIARITELGEDRVRQIIEDGGVR